MIKFEENIQKVQSSSKIAITVKIDPDLKPFDQPLTTATFSVRGAINSGLVFPLFQAVTITSALCLAWPIGFRIYFLNRGVVSAIATSLAANGLAICLSATINIFWTGNGATIVTTICCHTIISFRIWKLKQVAAACPLWCYILQQIKVEETESGLKYRSHWML